MPRNCKVAPQLCSKNAGLPEFILDFRGRPKLLGEGTTGLVKTGTVTTPEGALKGAAWKHPKSKKHLAYQAIAHEARMLSRANRDGGSPHVLLPMCFGLKKQRSTGQLKLWYIVMQRYSESLHHRLYDPERPINTSFMCSMALGIVRGLHHLKKRGIVHRDLKPQNVFLDGNVAVLADLGEACNIGDVLTTAAGTLKYMSPETYALASIPDGEGAVEGRDDVWRQKLPKAKRGLDSTQRTLRASTKGDVWAVGVIMGDMAVALDRGAWTEQGFGQFAHAGDVESALRRGTAFREDLRNLSVLAAQARLPKLWAVIIHRALTLDPTQRPDIDALAQMVEVMVELLMGGTDSVDDFVAALERGRCAEVALPQEDTVPACCAAEGPVGGHVDVKGGAPLHVAVERAGGGNGAEGGPAEMEECEGEKQRATEEATAEKETANEEDVRKDTMALLTDTAPTAAAGADADAEGQKPTRPGTATSAVSEETLGAFSVASPSPMPQTPAAGPFGAACDGGAAGLDAPQGGDAAAAEVALEGKDSNGVHAVGDFDALAIASLAPVRTSAEGGPHAAAAAPTAVASEAEEGPLITLGMQPVPLALSRAVPLLRSVTGEAPPVAGMPKGSTAPSTAGGAADVVVVKHARSKSARKHSSRRRYTPCFTCGMM